MINTSNLNKRFWNNYYTNTNDDINAPSTFATFIHDHYMDKERTILDLGAGNCLVAGGFLAFRGISHWRCY